MLKFNNTHIFTGYVKQLLSSVNIPTCKIYTYEFAEHFRIHGKEDPRIIESLSITNKNRLAPQVSYLKDDEVCSYFWSSNEYTPGITLTKQNSYWKSTANVHYDVEKPITGLTKKFCGGGLFYDTETHEYLGEYLRFLRDYKNINLMSLYNCFTNNICRNLNYTKQIELKDFVKEHKKVLAKVADSWDEKNHGLESENPHRAAAQYVDTQTREIAVTFNSQDTRYKIYMVPVKLFSNYTIAIDSCHGIEMFCGLYNTELDSSAKNKDLIKRTYQKLNKTVFSQPFLYKKLNVDFWNHNIDTSISDDGSGTIAFLNPNIMTRWDINNREQDLKLFIKVPAAIKSSIVILEGDYRHSNDTCYAPNENKKWYYKQNSSIVNLSGPTTYHCVRNDKDVKLWHEDNVELNAGIFAPVSKLQLLAFNDGDSYPFADRLIEYLSGSAITPADEIPDNIKRIQQVMNDNQYYFKISGIWENRMQKIIYDYIMNSGPVIVNNAGVLEDLRHGYHRTIGHTSKSNLYDVLGYVDKDAEKWYSCWMKKDKKDPNCKAAVTKSSIHSVDIYDKLYDL